MQKFLLLRSLNKMNHEKEETKQQRWALGLSMGLHGVLLVSFYFLPIGKPPSSLPLEYGIELHFEQSNFLEVPSSDQAQELAKHQTAPPEAVVEVKETQPPHELENESTTDAPTVTQEVPPTEEPTPQNLSDDEDFAPPQQVDEVREMPQITDTIPLAEQKNKATAQLDRQQEDSVAVDSNKQMVTAVKETPVESGTKFTPADTIDERALYNANERKPWNASLELADWKWDFAPQPQDTTDENGKIVFEIKIDDLGEVIAVKTLEKTVSPLVEKIYQEAVEKLTFSKTSKDASYAPTSVGKITFLIRSR